MHPYAPEGRRFIAPLPTSFDEWLAATMQALACVSVVQLRIITDTTNL